MSRAATSPTTPKPTMTIKAAAYAALGVSLNNVETSTEPTKAVPSEEPRFETLRDNPEISPWSCSGKLDCTMLTDDVSITPTPRPIKKRPGRNVQTREVA